MWILFCPLKYSKAFSSKAAYKVSAYDYKFVDIYFANLNVNQTV